jgi:hypothetical protein
MAHTLQHLYVYSKPYEVPQEQGEHTAMLVLCQKRSSVEHYLHATRDISVNQTRLKQLTERRLVNSLTRPHSSSLNLSSSIFFLLVILSA